jgi:hypothetical protein
MFRRLDSNRVRSWQWSGKLGLVIMEWQSLLPSIRIILDKKGIKDP